MQTKKYYKVVRRSDNGLCSYIHPLLGPEYKVGEWVEPFIKGSQLMCFDNLDSARSFTYDGLIYECEIKKYKGIPIFLYENNIYTKRVQLFLENILTQKRLHKKFSCLSNFQKAPKGTVFCSKIKLVKRAY